MDLFGEPSVRAIGNSMVIHAATGELSIQIDVLGVIPPPDALHGVRDVRLEYLRSFFTPTRTIANRYLLTIVGGPVRCAVVQNLISAVTQGDGVKRQRFLSIVNQ